LLRTLGRLCLVAAAILAGYMAWMLWGTGIITAKAQDQLRAELNPALANPLPPPTNPSLEPVFTEGDAIGEIIIPRINLDMVVVNGTSTQDLTKGPGLYNHSAFPWDDHGQVEIAGHRTTYLHPFWALDHMQKGDLIQIVTQYGTFNYHVTGTKTVPANDVQIVNQTLKPTLILTTCTPRFSATNRLVVFADRE
jgi:sortase A